MLEKHQSSLTAIFLGPQMMRSITEFTIKCQLFQWLWITHPNWYRLLEFFDGFFMLPVANSFI
jgi:hypothetical protein